MKPLTIFIVAGDPSGDLAAAELVSELKRQSGPTPPRFLGAGGPSMAAAGVHLRYELTRHSVIGIEILRRILWFRQVLKQLTRWAMTEVPDVVIGVDYAGFNLRLAETLRQKTARRNGPFSNWRPRLVQFVSPQVWASRPGRARRMERTHDLLLSILPFEPGWYARNAPRLPVRFVGHPIVDRHAHSPAPFDVEPKSETKATLVLLPGSRPGELQRHLPVMVPAAREAARASSCRIRMVLPREELRPLALSLCNDPADLGIQVGGLDEVLRTATVALASTGTVTMECAWYGVPTVAIYKTSRLTFAIGRRIVTVPHLAMPNLLAGTAIVPEYIQFQATVPALTHAVLELLENPGLRDEMRSRLRSVARSLGPPGTAARAAHAILELAATPPGAGISTHPRPPAA